MRKLNQPLPPDAPPPPGAVSVRTFAERVGIKFSTAMYYCRKGRVFGARKHPLTGKWWIYPPAKLLFPGNG